MPHRPVLRDRLARIGRLRLPALFASLLLAGLAPAALAAPPQPYQENDFRGFNDILPSGANGLANAPQLAAFLSTGARPPHSNDQLAMYGDLVYATPGLKPEELRRFFKDASFGVPSGQVERTYSPRADVTIQRDAGFGVAHIYGDGRPGAMFGAGYVAAEDRLFFIDVLRHVGRAELSAFVGGSPGNRALDAEQWEVAPYTEADLQRQVDQFDDLYGDEGRVVQQDLANYTAGVNAYIAAAKLNPQLLPGEYAAINRPQGPDAWQQTDVVAIAALVGGIFGKGGGDELGSAAVVQEAQKRFGQKIGKRVWQDFRSADDPEAPTTVRGRKFPYLVTPRRRARGSLALPDPGTLKKAKFGQLPEATASSANTALGGLLQFPSGNSNALVVSGSESESGHPLAVFGPQTGYFNPQILMEMDIHAPGTGGQPGIDARGAAFAGTNLYVQLGRGRDYAWSATSASQDIVDTFALDLCEPGGGPARLESTHYMYRGDCRPIEVLAKRNSWTPSAADMTPSGSETLRAERTALGIVTARATVSGRPTLYTKLRATYLHELDSAPGFVDFNSPERMENAGEFQRAAHKILYTFNWLYADDRDIAYFNSGANPIRAAGTDPNFPVRAQFEWQGYDPVKNLAPSTPFEQHPQVINQDYLTSWNNKQAPGYRASDNQFSYGSTYRNEPLDDRIIRGIRGNDKMSLVELIDAMEAAGTVDHRGDKVLEFALKMIGPQSDPKLADAVAKLKAWRRDGAHRRDRDRNGTYEHSDAIRIMDAWWPLWIDAQFKPTLGDDLERRIMALIDLDDEPNGGGAHLGSAYNGGWYGYAEKDLRTLLGRKVKGRYSRIYCGGGPRTRKGRQSRKSLRAQRLRCRKRLVASLGKAIDVPAAELYGKDSVCRAAGRAGDQTCFDSVRQSPTGAVTQPLIHWINRPTYQQALEIQGHRPR